MQIKVDMVTLKDGSDVYDLVLTQGKNVIRLGMISPDAYERQAELAQWVEDNTMDVVELVRAKSTKCGAA